LAVKINGSRGAQQESSVSTKEIVPFKRELPIQDCDVKNDPSGHRESKKKSDSDSQC